MVPTYIVMAYKALMNCSVELISVISVGRLFHSLMALGKRLCWYAVVEVTGVIK